MRARLQVSRVRYRELRISTKETGFFTDIKGEDSDIFVKKPGLCASSGYTECNRVELALSVLIRYPMGRFVRSRVTRKHYAQTLGANNVPSGVQLAVAIGVSVLDRFCVNHKDKHQAVSLAIAPLDRPSKMHLST